MDVSTRGERDLDDRPRNVARERKKDRRDNLSRLPHPIEAFRILIAFAVTQGVGYANNRTKGYAWISSTWNKRKTPSLFWC